MAKVTIDPITRIEGHLKIETEIDDGVVKDARSTGNLFRGIEMILRGRDPRDAQVIAQRIWCSVHGVAAALPWQRFWPGRQDATTPAYARHRGSRSPGQRAPSHLAASTTSASPAIMTVKLRPDSSKISSWRKQPVHARYEGDYRLPVEVNQMCQPLSAGSDLRRIGHETVAIFSGKIPHSVGIVPGGVTSTPTVDKITAFLWKVRKMQDFIDNVYIPDVLAIAGVYSDYLEIGAGCKNLISYGGYDLQGDDADLTTRKRSSQGTVSAADMTA
jgi:hydrogenase large subunit